MERLLRIALRKAEGRLFSPTASYDVDKVRRGVSYRVVGGLYLNADKDDAQTRKYAQRARDMVARVARAVHDLESVGLWLPGPTVLGNVYSQGEVGWDRCEEVLLQHDLFREQTATYEIRVAPNVVALTDDNLLAQKVFNAFVGHFKETVYKEAIQEDAFWALQELTVAGLMESRWIPDGTYVLWPWHPLLASEGVQVEWHDNFAVMTVKNESKTVITTGNRLLRAKLHTNPAQAIVVILRSELEKQGKRSDFLLLWDTYSVTVLPKKDTYGSGAEKVREVHGVTVSAMGDDARAFVESVL